MAGLLLIIASIFEFLLGNSFPSVVFAVYGGFWLSFAATLTPSFAAFASYAPEPLTAPAEGLTTQGFNASFGMYFYHETTRRRIKANNHLKPFGLCLWGSSRSSSSFAQFAQTLPSLCFS